MGQIQSVIKQDLVAREAFDRANSNTQLTVNIIIAKTIFLHKTMIQLLTEYFFLTETLHVPVLNDNFES